MEAVERPIEAVEEEFAAVGDEKKQYADTKVLLECPEEATKDHDCSSNPAQKSTNNHPMEQTTVVSLESMSEQDLNTNNLIPNRGEKEVQEGPKETKADSAVASESTESVKESANTPTPLSRPKDTPSQNQANDDNNASGSSGQDFSEPSLTVFEKAGHKESKDSPPTTSSSKPSRTMLTSSPVEEGAKLATDVCLSDVSPLSHKCSSTAISTCTVDSTHLENLEPIDIVRNGTISAGKPCFLAMNRATRKEKTERTGRAKKTRSLVAMYESEISENKTGIKLCIKKSENSYNSSTQTAAASVTATSSVSVSTTSSLSSSSQSPASTSKSRRGTRSLKRMVFLNSFTGTDEDSGIYYEPRRKKERSGRKVGSGTSAAATVRSEHSKAATPVEQTAWGALMPEPVLYNIFKMVVGKSGCLPTLCRLGRVCLLWRRVSLMPSLWTSLDLSNWIKEKYRTELKLKWFVDNRCSWCTELNVSNWKITNIDCFLEKLAVGAPKLMSITLAGWKGFTAEHLALLVKNMKSLKRLDLSSINAEMNASKSAVGLQSLCHALNTLNQRLTHLYLAHNRLSGIPHLVNALATHCSNLLLLDLSNVSTLATSHGILHIEKLQQGCPKLKVLRITNSHITFNTATMQEMMDSPGFPDLEELSIAALLYESRIVGDEHLQRILKTSAKLKLLDVRSSGRLTHESLIRLPAWDIKHLFLSGCSVTRDVGSGLELIASKWAHSLIELDLAWANVQKPLDNALHALADRGSDSQLAHLNLCGSSVSEDAVKEILANCPLMNSINLSSCRGLPRGVKRLMQGPQELNELREVLKVELKVTLPEELLPRSNSKKAAGLEGDHNDLVALEDNGP